jgi:hypothetical protein
VHEQFLTETARMADVVLPATMFLEHAGKGSKHLIQAHAIMVFLRSDLPDERSGKALGRSRAAHKLSGRPDHQGPSRPEITRQRAPPSDEQPGRLPA